jgi:repressor LexA
MTLFERVKETSKHRGQSLQQTAQKAGLGINSLYSWKQKQPSVERIQAVADVLHVSVDYLLGNTDIKQPISNLVPASKEMVQIPILGEIACGDPITAEENIEGYETEPADQVPNGEVFYLRSRGDSMEPTIPNGALVLIVAQSDVEDGQIAAVQVDDDSRATLKRVHHRGNAIILMPDNPKHSPIILNEENPGRIIGRATKVKFDL